MLEKWDHEISEGREAEVSCMGSSVEMGCLVAHERVSWLEKGRFHVVGFENFDFGS